MATKSSMADGATLLSDGEQSLEIAPVMTKS